MVAEPVVDACGCAYTVFVLLKISCVAPCGVNWNSYIVICGAWGSVVVKGAALLVGRSWDRSPVVSLGIFSVVPSDKARCPEVDSASENEYHGFLLG